MASRRRDTGKSRYFAKTEVNNSFIIRSPSLFFFIIKRETIYHFSRNLKSMGAWTQLRVSGMLFAAKSQLDVNAKVQTIICGQLFLGHKVGSVPMKMKEKVSSDNFS